MTRQPGAHRLRPRQPRRPAPPAIPPPCRDAIRASNVGHSLRRRRRRNGSRQAGGRRARHLGGGGEVGAEADHKPVQRPVRAAGARSGCRRPWPAEQQVVRPFQREGVAPARRAATRGVSARPASSGQRPGGSAAGAGAAKGSGCPSGAIQARPAAAARGLLSGQDGERPGLARAGGSMAMSWVEGVEVGSPAPGVKASGALLQEKETKKLLCRCRAHRG